MPNINVGRFSKEEVEGAFSARVAEVKMSSFNQGRGPDYSYWQSITHPQTGEKLDATRGYVDANTNRCYYAEYQSPSGEYYNYTAGLNGESIRQYQLEDAQERTENLRNAEARQQFRDFMNNEGGSSPNNQLANQNLNSQNRTTDNSINT